MTSKLRTVIATALLGGGLLSLNAQDPQPNPNNKPPEIPPVVVPQPPLPQETPAPEVAPTPAPPPAAPVPLETPTAPPTTPTEAPATEAGKPTGVITGSNVNVRGRASLKSEVVVQLQRGDNVVILEEINVPEPKAGEPGKWLRIALPSSVSVWVHGSFIDSATQQVKASQLNLRAGPGENHSVLGRVPQGTKVKELERKDPWVRIEPPDVISAYVAAFLVNVDGVPAAPPVSVAVTPPKTKPEPKPATPSVTPTTPPVIPATPVDPKPLEPPPTTPAEPVEVVVSPEEPVIPPIPAEPLLPPDIQDPSDPKPIEEEEKPKKRIAHREGVVLRSLSIQAPTEFVLHSPENKRVINYLHSTTTNITLKDYFGVRVLVSGEEVLDERWRNTPVLKVESLEKVP